MPDNKAKVLLIEDDPNTCILIKSLFEDAGYQVFDASHGPAGIEAAIKEMPQLIIVDLMLPAMSGLEVIKAVRASDTLKYVPVLVCTCRDKAIDVHKSFDVGANDYIAKPFNNQHLLHKAKKLMGHPLTAK